MKRTSHITARVLTTAGVLAATLAAALASPAPIGAAGSADDPPGRTAPNPGQPPLPRCTVRGTGKADVLRGSPRPDVICGLGGNDRIFAGVGDVVLGGAGNDTIYARNGRPNMLDGQAGDDRARADESDLLLSIETTL